VSFEIRERGILLPTWPSLSRPQTSAALLMRRLSTAYFATSPMITLGLEGVLNAHIPLLLIASDTAVVVSSGTLRSFATGAIATPSLLELGPSTISTLSRAANRFMSVIACAFSLAVSSTVSLIFAAPSMPLALTTSRPTSRPS
jgi:hypothetical protein